MSISKIKHAAKSLKTFQGIHFESCLDNGETEVEVGESKIEAIRETVNEMKRYGVHVRRLLFGNKKNIRLLFVFSGCHW